MPEHATATVLPPEAAARLVKFVRACRTAARAEVHGSGATGGRTLLDPIDRDVFAIDLLTFLPT